MKIIVLANTAIQEGGDLRKNPLEVLLALPSDCEVISIGSDLAELKKSAKSPIEEAKVLFICSCTENILEGVLKACPLLEWCQGLFAGLDHLHCAELVRREKEGGLVLTNAKGVFSSSLAEYVIAVCLHFNKDVPRWQANKKEKKWETFTVGELRGKTMGIVGYGSIGQSCAKLAKAFGMQVVGCRRRPAMSENDPNIDKIGGMDALHEIMSQSDYLVVAAALTKATEGMIDTTALDMAKEGQCFINVGRGKLVDEEALYNALKNGGRIKNAGLDVFSVEPLPTESKFWGLPNVLISSHNADMTAGFRHESTTCFVENCARFISGGRENLINIVSASEGY